jgi:hypothetical protein
MSIQIMILEDFGSKFDITCYKWNERIFYLQIQVFSSTSTWYSLYIKDAYIVENKSTLSNFKISHSVQISKPKSVDDNREI